ncbi:MAG: heme-binding protein [Clostridia bacterium]|nr:heme-binding protein [Clostridia bacterium]
MTNDNIANIVETIVKEVSQKASVSSINLCMAKRLIAKVEGKAKEMGLSVVVAVSDSAGNPVAVECMDGSYLASYDIAVKKAYTVVALKMSTLTLKNLSQPGQSLYGIQFTNDGKLVIFGGGDPLIYNSNIIGGIGVSGGSEDQDVELSEYGAKCLNEIINS